MALLGAFIRKSFPTVSKPGKSWQHLSCLPWVSGAAASALRTGADLYTQLKVAAAQREELQVVAAPVLLLPEVLVASEGSCAAWDVGEDR